MQEHDHDYLPASHGHSERQTRRVIVLTAVTMVVEVAAGMLFGSMALLADGWHMASHASALGITAFAYAYARRHAGDRRYAFGTYKVGVLGGYTSAVLLAIIALLIAWESVERLVQPVTIRFDEAIAVAVLGLLVNLVSAYLLKGRHHEVDGADGPRRVHTHDHDHNIQAAYLHVLADALTSICAIAALAAGRFGGWGWMDPVMGIVGAIIIARWSQGLLRRTAGILLDGDVEEALCDRIRGAIEEGPDVRVADLHVWRLGPEDLAVLASIRTPRPRPPSYYRERIRAEVAATHVTVEVETSCEPCVPPAEIPFTSIPPPG